MRAFMHYVVPFPHRDRQITCPITQVSLAAWNLWLLVQRSMLISPLRIP
jgi:hypothetical protein